MAELLHRKFKMPKRCNCKTIVLRETNGIDEQEAALQADARGARTNIYAELIRLSIVSVNGTPVQQPFIELERWNSRTRALVRQAYDSLNDLDEAEAEAFLAMSADETPTATPMAPSPEEETQSGHTPATAR